MLSYNGGLPGPTLQLQPGDRLRIELVNRLSSPTNLHIHGLHVSPQGNSDNPFTHRRAGPVVPLRLPPARQPPAGRVLVPPAPARPGRRPGLRRPLRRDHRRRTDPATGHPRTGAGRLRHLPRRADRHPATVTAMARMTGREGDLVLVNGQTRPRLTARPGERERWRIVNACTARYLRLRLDGQQMHLLGIDSGRYAEPRKVAEVVLAPGNRADLLVTTSQRGSRSAPCPTTAAAWPAWAWAAGMGRRDTARPPRLADERSRWPPSMSPAPAPPEPLPPVPAPAAGSARRRSPPAASSPSP